ncbi:Uncharacterized protein TCM_013659 [Theobroma cacao]|uniref:Uncharacterized protein n=1 Tax=Theobroma cacao TaxID=3641 RepID=A0A061G3S7_THECC|nr:Uncharacterized protein TCM_013659 [Theobroma cacao]
MNLQKEMHTTIKIKLKHYLNVIIMVNMVIYHMTVLRKEKCRKLRKSGFLRDPLLQLALKDPSKYGYL